MEEPFGKENLMNVLTGRVLQISVERRISRLSSGKDSALGMFLWVILTYDPGERDSPSLAMSC